MKKEAKQDIDFSTLNCARIGHNYLQKTKGGNYTIDELNLLNGYISHILDAKNRDLPTYKVGVMFVCVNQHYWQYLQPVVADTKAFFLPGHDVEIMVWSDMPNYPETKDVNYGTTIFPIDSVEWPYPTLMRYNYFLEQEEYLNKFDYLFYVDLDMRMINLVGDEILGDGLTMAQHPMYALRQSFWNPYEPNPESEAYIKQPGRVMEVNGQKVFQPLYAAGGIQGGTTKTFIPAMKAMKEGISKDLGKNYIARWNDESHWNKYLYEHPPAVVLNPSYVYPDSMIQEYYVKLWGCDYPPKIITLTKPFSVSSEGGAAAAEMMKTL